MRDGILKGIQSTYTDHQSDDSLTDTTINDNTSSAITESLDSQDDIGWNHFIRGRLIVLFKSQLAIYFQENKLGKRYNPSIWYKNIIIGL